MWYGGPEEGREGELDMEEETRGDAMDAPTSRHEERLVEADDLALIYPSASDLEIEYLGEGIKTKGKGKGREEDGGEPNWAGTLLPLETGPSYPG